MVRVDIGAGALDVWVESSGTKLEEHRLQALDAQAKQECHVASVADEEFRIVLQPSTRTCCDQRVDVYLDGVWVRASTLRAGSLRCLNFQGAIVAMNVERSFTFGKLTLKEDDSSSAPGAHAELGTIRIMVRAVTLQGQTGSVLPQVRLPGEEAVSEKAKKAGSHAARLGATRAVVTAPFVSTVLLPGWPTHEVIFRYAPIDYLRAREIVSDAPAPASSGMAVKVEGGVPNTIKVEVGAKDSTSRAENSRKRAIADVIDISDDEGGEVDGLTAEERAQYARLEAKRRAAASGKEKHSSLTKKPKSEPSDRHFNEDVINLSD